ncbi:MAG: glycosyltransferase family 39 protein [Candidatus Omnitrophica bacterium]|nr:glycosyltransferase family 39 protein [Candidatus Omnitrophota bacterium]
MFEIIKKIKGAILQMSLRRKLMFLTAAAGIYILLPLNNFQFFLAQGDHGRELYAFKKTVDGALPYKDYSWLFGPLMPCYYSVFFRLFGTSIQSVLIGQNLLIWSCGMLIYATCAVFLSPVISLIAALWYWAFRGAEFFYAYNHTGGLLAILATVYFLFRYLKQPRLPYAAAGFAATGLLTLIRPNMGIAVLAAFFISLCLAETLKKEPLAREKIQLHIYSALLTLASVFLIYWFLLHSLPSHIVQQSFPFSKSYRLDATAGLPDTLALLGNIAASYLTAAWPNAFLNMIFFICLAQLIFMVIRRRLPERERTEVILIFASLFLFLVSCLHEFMGSGVPFRLIWLRPLLIITAFYALGIATRKLSLGVFRAVLLIIFIYLPLVYVLNQNIYIQFFKDAGNGLFIGKTRIYTSQDSAWFNAVREATEYITSRVPANEKIFALPHDALYYFLSGRDGGSRQLAFFDHAHIMPAQELDIIGELERNGVNYVIVSNRSDEKVEGLGIFGKTYCPFLAAYLNERFETVAVFGDWQHPPGWAWSHGVKILKRRVPLKTAD